MFLAELQSQELVNEGQVVVDRSHLEDLLADPAPARVFPVALLVQIIARLVLWAMASLVPAAFDVSEQLDAELVWVESQR